MDVADLPHQLQSADARHLHVAEHEIQWSRGHDGHRFGRVAGGGDTVPHAAENPLEGVSVELLVVYDEDMGLLQGGTSAAGGGEASL